MNLTYAPTFSDLFSANRKEVDYILQAACRTQTGRTDLQDLYQEVFYRLMKDPFLKRYDPTKSKLHTYLTNTARKQVNHIMEKVFHKPSWYEGDKKIGKWTRVYDTEVNGVSEDDLAPQNMLFDKEDIEKNLEDKDYYAVLRNRLRNENEQVIYDHCLQGRSKKQITVVLSKKDPVTETAVSEVSASMKKNLITSMKDSVLNAKRTMTVREELAAKGLLKPATAPEKAGVVTVIITEEVPEVTPAVEPQPVKKIPTPWTRAELEASVDAYLDMLTKQIKGIQYSKSEVSRTLRSGALKARSDGAFKFRMQNISSVMEDLGLSWIIGWPPAKNIGSKVSSEIKDILGTKDLTGVGQFSHHAEYWRQHEED